MENHAQTNGLHHAAKPRIHFEASGNQTAVHPVHIEGSGLHTAVHPIHIERGPGHHEIAPPVHLEGNQVAVHPVHIEKGPGFQAAVPLIHFEENQTAVHPVHIEGSGNHAAVHPIHIERGPGHHDIAPPVHFEGNHAAVHPIHIENGPGHHTIAPPVHFEGNHVAVHPIHFESGPGHHAIAPPVHFEGNQTAVHPIHFENNHEAPNIIDVTPQVPVVAPPFVPVVNELTDYMRKGLAVVAQNEGFVNYTIHDEKGSNFGDGFVGIMFKVHIHEVNSDKQLTVMLKAPPANITRRTEFGALRLFKREVLMYTKVLPAFVAFQDEKHIKKANGFYNFPKCYFAEFDDELQDSVIIMEDLHERGCKMWDKYKPANFEHARYVMEYLGRLHAVSFAMKAQRPDIFDEFKELEDFMSTIQNDGFDQMMNAAMENAIAGIPANTPNVRGKMLRLQAELKQVMMDLVRPEQAEPFAVIGHGDCWTNNFMFEYRRNRPEGIVLLDWQISRYCSPVLDLMYFIFVCTDSAMRAKHYDELLGIYHRSLKDLLDHLGGDTMSQFPFTALLRQLKAFGKFGITMGVFLIPMITTKNEDLPDMDAMADKYKDQDLTAMDGFMMQTSESGQSRLNGAIADAVKYGYL